MKLDPETIDQQQKLLATYRRTLDQLLIQAAQYGGEPFAPPAVANGIAEAREQIDRIKIELRASDLVVPDQPGDSPPVDSGDRAAAHPHAQPAIHENTQVSGDHASGDIDKRQGMFISDGSPSGLMIGVSTGTVNMFDQRGGAAAASSQLDQVLARVQQAADQARQRGDDDLADDLGGVVMSLQAAARAQREGKLERRAAKLAEAAAALDRAAIEQPALRELPELLRNLRP